MVCNFRIIGLNSGRLSLDDDCVSDEALVVAVAMVLVVFAFVFVDFFLVTLWVSIN